MNFAIGKNQLKASGKKRAHWVSKEAKIALKVKKTSNKLLQ